MDLVDLRIVHVPAHKQVDDRARGPEIAVAEAKHEQEQQVEPEGDEEGADMVVPLQGFAVALTHADFQDLIRQAAKKLNSEIPTAKVRDAARSFWKALARS